MDRWRRFRNRNGSDRGASNAAASASGDESGSGTSGTANAPSGRRSGRRSGNEGESTESRARGDRVAGREIGRVGATRTVGLGERAVNAVVRRSVSGVGGSGARNGGAWGRVMSRMMSCVGGGQHLPPPTPIPRDTDVRARGVGRVDSDGNIGSGGNGASGGDNGSNRESTGRAILERREREREGRRRGRDRERARGRPFSRRSRLREGRPFGGGGRGLEDMEFLMVMNRVFEEYREREWERERGGALRESGFWDTGASEMLAEVERARALEEILEELPTFVIEKGGVGAAERLFSVLREGIGRVESVEDIIEVLEGARNVKQVDKRDGECVICLGSYEVGDEVLILPCAPQQHYFHGACIRPWVRKTGDCPSCRSRVDSWKNGSERGSERTPQA